MPQRSKTEITTNYATTVDNLSDAWTFIMKHVDKFGTRPSIVITPCWSSDDGGNPEYYFDVSISGMVQDPND